MADNTFSNDPHQFHIPVMGTGFTIDTPIKIAKYGISSVISIGDDALMERLRKFYLKKSDRPYHAIHKNETDSRARRIRAYLNLVQELVEEKTGMVQSDSFEQESDLTQYFEMLPEGSLKNAYRKMLACPDSETKLKLQTTLRQQVVAGRIDVNIMAKVNREPIERDGKSRPENGLAMSALRGFATTNLNSAVILSAGLNRRLYAYMSRFDDFFPGPDGPAKKSIILKVSDYRSALLQGRFLAKKGLWVSEFRIESGLNCGGHAFANIGELMGPILEEFKSKRAALKKLLWEIYLKALNKLGRRPWGDLSIRITAQGGVGTADEHTFLKSQFDLDSIGWGTPFLLVPEVTNVDVAHLGKLISAGEDDVILSDASPLGIPFWNLRTSTGEKNRRRQIEKGVPGSRCLKGYLRMDTEFTNAPICQASRKYQKQKLNQLENSHLPAKRKQATIAQLQEKSCLCAVLAGGALNRLGIETNSQSGICCGPGIADFDRVYTLKEMVDHIYGRISLIGSPNRLNMLIKELSLYIDYFQRRKERAAIGLEDISTKYFDDFKQNLIKGINYYRDLALRFTQLEKERFLSSLDLFEEQIRRLGCGLEIAPIPAGALAIDL